MAMIGSLHAQGERYLRLKLDMPAHKRHSDDEHQEIFKALRAGKIDEAARVLQHHLLQTGELLADYLTEHLAKSPAKGDARRANRVRAA
jgi:DNA-binding GntR family transcriptional regulator